jgi:anaerobic magnesium-protoporphyrin IX monomethyl ester cyclase
MATILLYNPQSTSPGKQRLPLSLLSIASVVVPDYAVEFIDGNLIADPATHIVARAGATNALLLAVSVMPGPQLRQAVAVCKLVKAALPALKIVWGGYFPTHYGELTVRSGYVDFCVEGQGEAPFRKLVDTLHKGGALADVPSLWYMEAGTPKLTARAPLVPLNNLPALPYDQIDMERYAQKHYMGNRCYPHHSSFGCPFACSFCAVVALSHQRWLAESATRVAQTVTMLHKKYGADSIEFHDMDFFVSEARTAEFSERIANLGLSWWGLGRADTLMAYSDASFVKMKKSGVKMIFMGAESGSDAMLKQMNKGGNSSTEVTRGIVRRMKQYGIVPELSFVLGNPPEPLADIEASIAFIKQLKRENEDIELILYIYTPVPQDGAALYEEAKRQGFRFPETLEEWVGDEWTTYALRRDPNTPWFKDDARRRVRNFETVINAYYPTVTDQRLRKSALKLLLKGLSGWRYKLGFYQAPYELKALQKLVRYRRPETTGF